MLALTGGGLPLFTENPRGVMLGSPCTDLRMLIH
jgi:hypothetical protein